ncbi:MAG: 4Fe-4S dicluster domain-containing protein [Candidatus Helarchaeota archaeon]
MDHSKSVLIVGAGIAGLQAAVELADCEYNVILLEKKVSGGGNVQKLYKVFPTDDCAFCTVATKHKSGIRKCFYRAGITQHPHIQLIVNCEITSIEGEKGDFKVHIVQHPRYVNFNCTHCGKCEEVCPVELKPVKWNEIPRKAIYLPANMCIPQTYVIDRERCPSDCQKCLEACPFEGVINLEEQRQDLQFNVAAIILATGYNEFDPKPLFNLKYGVYKNVITQIELAQMLDPNGPTEGKLIRPSDNEPVQNLVMIQCVGSRDQNFKKYCSSICCAYACKHARIIKAERNSDLNVTIIYMDVRTFGMLERYYRECRELGIDFVRGRVAEISQKLNGKLNVLTIDTLLQKSIIFEVDLVVLTPALIPNMGKQDIFKMLGVKFDENGFIGPISVDKTLTSVDGIYICGAGLAPADFPSSITLARSAVFNVIKQIEGGESEL